jgi:CRISPR-associated endonuclease/helicase Cas3
MAPFLYQWEIGEWFAPRMYIVEPVHALLRQMRDRVKVYVSALGRGSITVDEDHGELLRPTYLSILRGHYAHDGGLVDIRLPGPEGV